MHAVRRPWFDKVSTSEGLPPAIMTALAQDRADNLWLGNNNGLFVRRADSQRFVRPEHPAGKVATVLEKRLLRAGTKRQGGAGIGDRRAHLHGHGRHSDCP